MRFVNYDGKPVGSTRKFVGKTARTMGSEPAWVGYPRRGFRAATFTTYEGARQWVLSHR